MVLNQHAYLYNESEKVDFPIFVLLVPHCALTKALQFYPMQETENWSNFGFLAKIKFQASETSKDKTVYVAQFNILESALKGVNGVLKNMNQFSVPDF